MCQPYETGENAVVRISEAREDLAELVNRAGYGGERVQLTRHGRPVAAIISAEDLALLESLEDAADLRAIADALADPENQGTPIPLDDLR
jgi:prevent-host-death family protein